jgi:AraC-like DNA-binding protein
MAKVRPVADLGMDWGLNARKYDYHLSEVLAYVEVKPPLSREESTGDRAVLDYHEGMEFGVVLSGSLERHWDDFSYVSRAGDVWLASMWEPHGYRKAEEGTASVQVYFLPDFIGDMKFDGFSWLTVFSAPPGERPRPSSDAQRARILTWGERLRDEAESQAPQWLTAVKLAIINILFELSRDWHPPRKVTAKNGDPQVSLARIMPALDLVRERWPRFVKIEQAARVCHVSRTTLNRLFRDAMGITFGRFRLRTHLARAAYLLLTSDLSTERIAEETGFSDGSHFHRAFVHHYGQTPGQYREGIEPSSSDRL